MHDVLFALEVERAIPIQPLVLISTGVFARSRALDEVVGVIVVDPPGGLQAAGIFIGTGRILEHAGEEASRGEYIPVLMPPALAALSLSR